jgi:quercetin dioxygenase-like cupin family protein
MKQAKIVVALVVGMAAGAVFAAGEVPKENKGFKAAQLSAFDMGKQGLKDYEQRQMRIRRIDFEPGGIAAFHSHSQRPALSYILAGELVEHRNGAPDRVYKAGDVITETTDVDHWAENKGTAPVTIISVDLFKE